MLKSETRTADRLKGRVDTKLTALNDLLQGELTAKQHEMAKIKLEEVESRFEDLIRLTERIEDLKAELKEDLTAYKEENKNYCEKRFKKLEDMGKILIQKKMTPLANV